MSITYSYLIQENVAPANADKVGIYDSEGNRVGGVAIPSDCKLNTSELGEKLYSFGCISDIHLSQPTGTEDYRVALLYFAQNENVDFTCICGDLTQDGTAEQLHTYRTFTTNYASGKTVYAMPGNHEGRNSDIESIISEYTGNPVYYDFEKGNDVFIMFGCKSNEMGTLFTEESLRWLYAKLEVSRNKRVFLFQHVRPNDACGNAFGIYAEDKWGGQEQVLFEGLIRHYKNVILLHGHSHLKFYLQYGSSTANYDKAFGVHSIHIPSLVAPRDGDASGASSLQNIYAESEGYVVDVYQNHVVFRGRDFVDQLILPMAMYKLDTTLTTVEQGTFVNPSSISLVDTNISSITLNKTSSTGTVGGSETLTYTISPTSANTYNLSWSTSDSSVATVSNGVVTFVSAGNVDISIVDSVSNKTATCSFVISEASSGGDTPTELPVFGYDDVVTSVEQLNLGLQNTSNWEDGKQWSGSTPFNISGGTVPETSSSRSAFKPYIKLPSGSYTVNIESTDNGQVYARLLSATGSISSSVKYSNGDTYTSSGTGYLKLMTSTDATFGDSTGITKVSFTAQ